MRENRGAFKIESPADLSESSVRQGPPEARFLFGIDEQKTASPSPDQFTAERSVAPRISVAFIDGGTTHAFGSILLTLPMDVKQFRIAAQVAGFEGRLAFQTELFYEVEIIDHFAVPTEASGVLVAENAGGGTSEPSEEQEQIVLQIVKRFRCDLQRCGLDFIVGQETETGQSPECGDILILFADRLSQPLQFDVACLGGQLVGMHDVLAVRVQRLQQRCGEAAGRAQARACRDIGHAGYLQVHIAHADDGKGLSDYRVLDILDAGNPLEAGVLND